MNRKLSRTLAGALALASLAACSESTTDPIPDGELAAAFLSVPLGFDNAVSTFQPGTNGTSAFVPQEQRGRRGPDDSSMMGGGLDGVFLGKGFGTGFGRGPHGDPALIGRCPFNAATGRIECEPRTFRGLTVQRSGAFADASGAVQSEFDLATTNTVNARVSVTGTVTRRDGLATTVQNSSDRTVSGLARGSSARTVNGTSAGQETTTGTDSASAFTVVRVAADTTTNVVVPLLTEDGRAFPTGGTVVRSMRVTLTRPGGTTTATRREVVTFDGSDTARLEVTQNGVSFTCALPLTRGRPVCTKG